MAEWAKLYYQNGAFVHQRGTIFEIRPSDPGWTTEVDRGILYTKLVSGVEEVFWQRSDNTVEQITPVAAAGGGGGAFGLLSKVTSADLTATGVTALFTAPEETVVTKVVMVPTTITGAITTPPRLGIGINVTEDDVIANQAVPGFVIGKAYTFDLEGQTEVAQTSESIDLGVDTAVGGATVLLVDVYLFGYFTSASASSPGGGRIIQAKSNQTQAVVSCTGGWAYDNTIPQSSEGIEVLTVTITPTNLNNFLEIELNASGGLSGSGAAPSLALFRDADINALAVVHGSSGTTLGHSYFKWRVAVPSVLSQVWRIRGGASAGTWHVNGDAAGGSRYGGRLSCQMTVKEVSP